MIRRYSSSILADYISYIQQLHYMIQIMETRTTNRPTSVVFHVFIYRVQSSICMYDILLLLLYVWTRRKHQQKKQRKKRRPEKKVRTDFAPTADLFYFCSCLLQYCQQNRVAGWLVFTPYSFRYIHILRHFCALQKQHCCSSQSHHHHTTHPGRPTPAAAVAPARVRGCSLRCRGAIRRRPGTTAGCQM